MKISQRTEKQGNAFQLFVNFSFQTRETCRLLESHLPILQPRHALQSAQTIRTGCLSIPSSGVYPVSALYFWNTNHGNYQTIEDMGHSTDNQFFRLCWGWTSEQSLRLNWSTWPHPLLKCLIKNLTSQLGFFGEYGKFQSDVRNLKNITRLTWARDRTKGGYS